MHIIIAIIWPLVILRSIISIDDHFVKLHSLFTVSFNSVKSISKLWTRLRTEGCCPASLFIQTKLFDPKFSKLSCRTPRLQLSHNTAVRNYLLTAGCSEVENWTEGFKLNYSSIESTRSLTRSSAWCWQNLVTFYEGELGLVVWRNPSVALPNAVLKCCSWKYWWIETVRISGGKMKDFPAVEWNILFTKFVENDYFLTTKLNMLTVIAKLENKTINFTTYHSDTVHSNRMTKLNYRNHNSAKRNQS